MRPELSVVVPMFDEQDALPLLVPRLRSVLDGLGCSYEVLAVDDGSKDLTPALLERERRQWPQLRVVRLRTNAGHQAALSAGLVRALGAYVVTIDADLQDPPEAIGAMLVRAREDRLDVVYGVRSDRSSDTVFKRGTAHVFYSLIRAVSGTDAANHAGDFRLMSRATVDAINQLPERNRVLRLVVPALGFPSGEVTYIRSERSAGRSKYSLAKMLSLSLDSFTGFSTAPLRVATALGVGGALVAFLFAVYVVVNRIVGNPVAGWASTIVVVVTMGAIQLLCLGLLGEYVARMYLQMQGRPAYFVAYDSLHDAADQRPEPAAPPRSDLPVE
jgi:dolichol-phosphate mannosyltransferase